MARSDPALQGDDPPEFITAGESMLRLTPPDPGTIRVAGTFEASYGIKR